MKLPRSTLYTTGRRFSRRMRGMMGQARSMFCTASALTTRRAAEARHVLTASINFRVGIHLSRQ